MIHLKIYCHDSVEVRKVEVFKDNFPVKVRYVRVVDGVGDIFQGLGVDFLVPVQHLLNVFTTLLNFSPKSLQKCYSTKQNI